MDKADKVVKLQRPHLVQTTAAKLRDIILAKKPETQIGSLSEIARRLDVGIVTVQQAARILEHEGLLAVRRGPGGGYYGMRPDEAALERSIAAYMRVHGSSVEDAIDIVTLLRCEILPAAAACPDEALRDEMRALSLRIDACDSEKARLTFEEDFYALLFKMDGRPLFELLARVALRLYNMPPQPFMFFGEEGVAAWKAAKRRMLDAILKRDPDLARFEAVRYRELIKQQLQDAHAAAAKASPPRETKHRRRPS